jgi:hypothetical protein
VEQNCNLFLEFDLFFFNLEFGKAAGGFAGGIGSAIATPLDLLKTKAQASSVPTNTIALARQVVQQDGIKGI